MKTFEIAVLSGDGIGPEVMAPCLSLLRAVTERLGGFALNFLELEAGAELYRRTGEALPETVLDVAGAADAILLGAMGDPEIRYPDGTEVVPQIDLREHFGLYAGVRPVRVLSAAHSPLSDPRGRDVDFILIRESTEGLFAARKESHRDGDAVLDTMRISRGVSERLFRFAFELARSRKQADRPGRLTCVDKANVLPSTAFFRALFEECASDFPDIQTDFLYVDAAGLKFVRSPWDFDVLVTENMFGDILSDVGAALMGGMGMAPSADIGDRHAVFQPCHGTAPDIKGLGRANPTAMILSGAMMLDWLGNRHGIQECVRAADLLVQATEDAFADPLLVPFENGGSAGTQTISEAVRRALD